MQKSHFAVLSKRCVVPYTIYLLTVSICFIVLGRCISISLSQSATLTALPPLGEPRQSHKLSRGRRSFWQSLSYWVGSGCRQRDAAPAAANSLFIFRLVLFHGRSYLGYPKVVSEKGLSNCAESSDGHTFKAAVPRLDGKMDYSVILLVS